MYVELDFFSGGNNKLDAINLYTFMTDMVKIETLRDIQKAVETMKRTYMLVMMEDSHSPATSSTGYWIFCKRLTHFSPLRTWT